jgi:hypothetical protein
MDVMRKAKEISPDRAYSYGMRRVRQTMSVHNVGGVAGQGGRVRA